MAATSGRLASVQIYPERQAEGESVHHLQSHGHLGGVDGENFVVNLGVIRVAAREIDVTGFDIEGDHRRIVDDVAHADDRTVVGVSDRAGLGGGGREGRTGETGGDAALGLEVHRTAIKDQVVLRVKRGGARAVGRKVQFGGVVQAEQRRKLGVVGIGEDEPHRLLVFPPWNHGRGAGSRCPWRRPRGPTLPVVPGRPGSGYWWTAVDRNRRAPRWRRPRPELGIDYSQGPVQKHRDLVVRHQHRERAHQEHPDERAPARECGRSDSRDFLKHVDCSSSHVKSNGVLVGYTARLAGVTTLVVNRITGSQ